MRHVVFVGHVGDAAQFVRRSNATADAWHYGEGPVLLDVGVYAIIDEARRAVFLVVAAPQHVEHVAQRRLADFAAQAIAIDLQHLLDGLELLAAQDFAQVVFRERNTGAERFLRLFLEFRRHGLEELLAKRGATAAAGRSAGALLQLRERTQALVVNGLDDGSFGHAHASADGFAVGHLGHIQARVFGRIRKQELPAQLARGPSRRAAIPYSDDCLWFRPSGSTPANLPSLSVSFL